MLELGCGSGTLLAGLREANHRRLVGAQLDEQKILAGISRGLDVIQADLNKGLGVFASGEFDCVVLSQTLQAVHDVERVLTEMVRIGRTCIVSIPNFGFHRLRTMLAETGRAPKINKSERVVVTSTAHGLKFVEIRVKYHPRQLEFPSRHANDPIELPARLAAIKEALGKALQTKREFRL